MREGIHPNFEKTTITCHCGNVMETMSTKKDIKVEICAKCHPFLAGRYRRTRRSFQEAFQPGLSSTETGQSKEGGIMVPSFFVYSQR